MYQSPWLVSLSRNPDASMRLYGFPFAGGGSRVFDEWPQALPSVEVFGLQLPGRERRPFESLVTEMEEVVDRAIPALSFDKPFVFFGHSLGALIAFEVTCRLRESGLPCPMKLFVSGAVAPRMWEQRPAMSVMSDRELCKFLNELGGMPTEALKNQELMAILLPVLRADLAICDGYRYVRKAPLHIPIAAYGGTEDDRAPKAEIDQWRDETSQDFELRMFTGGHFFLRQPDSGALAVIAADVAAISVSAESSRSHCQKSHKSSGVRLTRHSRSSLDTKPHL